VTLFDISRVPCWRCVGDVWVSCGWCQWLHAPPCAALEHYAVRNAPRLSRPSRIGISNSVVRCALMRANRSPVDGTRS
jgi:hypothetical protein